MANSGRTRRRFRASARGSRSRKRRATLARCRPLRLEQLEQLVLLTAVPTGPNIGIPPFTTIQTLEPEKDQVDIQVATISSTSPLLNGDFIVAWQHEFDSPERTDTDIFYRLYDANGLPKTFALSADDFLLLDEQDPRIDAADDGSFVITWETTNESGDQDVMYRLFDPTGAPLTTPLIAHGPDELDQQNPDVAMYADGDFILVWETQVDEDENLHDIQFRRFEADGTPIDDSPLDAADEDRDETFPRIAVPKAASAAVADTFIITWTDLSDRGDHDIFRDVRDRGTGESITDGPALVTDEDDTLTRDQLQSAVDADEIGNFVVTFYEIVSGSNRDVFLRLYEPDGSPDPDAVLRLPVDDDPTVSADEQAVAMSGVGSFIVVYEVNNGTSDTVDIRYRWFDAEGSTSGVPQNPLLPEQEPGDQDNPEVAITRNGEFTIVWDDNFYATSSPFFEEDVFARNYRHDVNTAGLYDPATSTFFLRNSNTEGVADITFNYGIVATPRWVPIIGDWDGDGDTTIGLYDPTSAVFFLRNLNSVGPADVTPFNFGLPGWLPVAGDWDGDGVDTIGAYDPTSAIVYLRNSNDSGVADISFTYGRPGGDLVPIVGDWDGDGIESIGLYNPTPPTPGVGRFLLRNDLTTGAHDERFDFGTESLSPVSGDWDRDGVDTIGVWDPATALFSLLNEHEAGPADIEFLYGLPSPPTDEPWIPIMGDWDGPGADPLFAAAPSIEPPANVEPLTAEALQPIVDAAIANWVAVGLDPRMAVGLSQRRGAVAEPQLSSLGT